MTYEFEQFADSLNDEERGALLSTVPFLTALVARADGKYTLREKLARWKSFVAARTDLDPSFVSKEASIEVERYLSSLKSVSADDPQEARRLVVKELRRFGAVIRKMPDPLERRFERFLVEVCFGVAEASGRFLWIGDDLSEAEVEMLRLIIKELRLRVVDTKVREALGLD